jgi:hypothetical protein
VDRIDGLIEELPSFLAQGLHLADVNVNKVLNDLVTSCAEVGDERIVFRLAFDPSLRPCGATRRGSRRSS